MHKESISIQILGSNQTKLNQYRSQIANLINKEITTLFFDPALGSPLYKDKSPPQLLIFLLDDSTIEALNHLSALHSAVRPALLVISEKHDKQQMRLAMQAGARDFFTSPLDAHELQKSLNQILFDLKRGSSQQGTLTTVINAKGGSGGSLITCNLAHLTAIASNSSVVLMDFDLQFGSQSINLDLKPKHTIVEALNDVSQLDFDAIDGYMTQHRSGLRLLSTVSEQLVLPGEISVENLEQLLALTVSNYDRIYIDLPRQIDSLSACILERSDQIVIVVQQSLAHMRDAKRLTRILKSEFSIASKNIIIVINRYDADGNLKIKDVQATLECDHILTVPNDYEKAAQSTNLGIPLYDYAPNSTITRALISLIESLNVNVKSEFRDTGFFQKLFRSKSG